MSLFFYRGVLKKIHKMSNDNGILTPVEINELENISEFHPAPKWNVKVCKNFGYPHNIWDSPTKYTVIFEDTSCHRLPLNRPEWEALMDMRFKIYRLYVMTLVAPSRIATLFRGCFIKMYNYGWSECKIPLQTEMDITFIWNEDLKESYIQLHHLLRDAFFVTSIHDFWFFFLFWVPDIQRCIELADEYIDPYNLQSEGSETIGSTMPGFDL